MDSRFLDAFNEALAHDLDRAMLIQLLEAEREVRYEELRKSVGSPQSQSFQYALERLMDHAMVNRRLEPWGEERYKTLLSPTARGMKVARILQGLATEGRIPAEFRDELGEELASAFRGRAPA